MYYNEYNHYTVNLQCVCVYFSIWCTCIMSSTHYIVHVFILNMSHDYHMTLTQVVVDVLIESIKSEDSN